MKPSEAMDAVERIVEKGWIHGDHNHVTWETIIQKEYPCIDIEALCEAYQDIAEMWGGGCHTGQVGHRQLHQPEVPGGRKGGVMPRPLQYSWEFMAKAIASFHTLGSLHHVALIYGIAPRTLERWKHRYNRDRKFRQRIDDALK